MVEGEEEYEVAIIHGKESGLISSGVGWVPKQGGLDMGVMHKPGEH
jgi:hypothetical protein